MRILIDECLPVALKKVLGGYGHECEAVRHAGLASKKNGELLSIAEGRWDVPLTSDRNLHTSRISRGGESPSLFFERGPTV